MRAGCPRSAWNELDGPFWQGIRDAGFPREQVDLVVCTHLHIDHEAAIAARRGFCGRFGDTGITVAGTHWAAPTGVLLTAHGDVWKTQVD